MYRTDKKLSSFDIQNADNGISAEFERDQLLSALMAVSAAQAELEIGWVQIVFSGDDKITFSSVNNTLAIQCILTNPHSGTGIVKVSGRQLSDYVKQLPPEKITLFAVPSSSLKLRCGRSSAHIQLIQDQSNVQFDVPPTANCVAVKAGHLKRWIPTFKDFVCIGDNRFYANGALIWIERGTELHATASDSYRLARTSLFEGVEVKESDGKNILVPRKVLDELHRVASLSPEGKDFYLRWCSKTLSFVVETEDYTLFTKGIEGTYPPYESAIPKTISISVKVDLKLIQDSVKRLLLFADKKIMKMQFEGSLITIKSSTFGQNEGEEIIELEEPVSRAFEVSYNAQFLMNILNVLGGSQFVTFDWEETIRPMKVKGEDQRGIFVFYLIVPVRN